MNGKFVGGHRKIGGEDVVENRLAVEREKLERVLTRRLLRN